MYRKFPIVIASLLFLAFSFPAAADLDWAMFRTYTSPAWVTGYNGLLTLPTTQVVGPGSLAFASSGIDSGEVFGRTLVFATGSVHYGLGNLMELSVTKKAFLVEDKMSEVEGQTLGAKLRLKKGTLPIAVGATALNLAAEPTTWTKKSTFLTVYGVTQLEAGPIRLHPGVEIGLLGNNKTEPMFFLGADLRLAKLLFMAEAVGTNEQGQGGILNAGVAFAGRKEKGLRLAVSAYDLGDENRLMAQTSLVF